MLIFYLKGDSEIVTPCVILDAMSSDDRFSDMIIAASVALLAPAGVGIGEVSVFSCEYSAEFTHVGIPLGQGLKSHFSSVIKSPPAVLIKAFTPSYLTSAQSLSDFANAAGLIANPQTVLTYGAMIVKGQIENITRKFLVYAAPIYPDPMGTTTTMVVSGAMLEDVLITSECACQIDKMLPLSVQLTALLAAQSPPMIGVYTAPQALLPPVTNILFPPMKLTALLDEICLQNKMVWAINGQIVTFYSAVPSGAPDKVANFDLTQKTPEFSFLGYKGFLAWGLSVENYCNIKFNTALYDPTMFGKATLYNDIKSSFFSGLVKKPSLPSFSIISGIIDAYDTFIIRYSIKWSRDESLVEVTATNNWVMSQIRVDGLLEASIYSKAAKG